MLLFPIFFLLLLSESIPFSPDDEDSDLASGSDFLGFERIFLNGKFFFLAFEFFPDSRASEDCEISGADGEKEEKEEEEVEVITRFFGSKVAGGGAG